MLAVCDEHDSWNATRKVMLAACHPGSNDAFSSAANMEFSDTSRLNGTADVCLWAVCLGTAGVWAV